MHRTSLLIGFLMLLSGCQSTAPKLAESTLAPLLDNAMKSYQYGDLQLAEGMFRQLISRDPSLVVAWCHLGHIGFRQHHYEAALNAYQQCLRYQPQQPDIWQNMAVIRLRQASELLIQGSAFFPPDDEGYLSNPDYPRLIQSLMVLQRLPQTE